MLADRGEKSGKDEERSCVCVFVSPRGGREDGTSSVTRLQAEKGRACLAGSTTEAPTVIFALDNFSFLLWHSRDWPSLQRPNRCQKEKVKSLRGISGMKLAIQRVRCVQRKQQGSKR